MTVSLHSTNRPINASDQASPVAIATTITSASGGSPSDWFAHSDITPLSKPMTAAIGIGSGEPLSENTPDPFADSGPSIFFQDDQPFAHDPDFYNGHGAPNPFAEAAGSAGLHGAVAHLSRVQEVFVQGLDEGEHQSESKTLEEQSAGLIPAIKKEIWSKISRQVFLLPRKNLKRPSFLLRKTT